MRFRGLGSLTAILLIAASLLGCSKWDIDEAPTGFAIVREHMVYAPRNDPVISSTLDFTITAVDGKAVIREAVPRWVDIQQGALISAGKHDFEALVMPHLRRPSDVPRRVSFTATVASGKVYFIVDDQKGNPVLIESHLKKK